MTRVPVVAAWGAGVDSSAMIVELAERGEPIDMVLFADPGSEKAGTYTFIPVFRRWMADRGIPSEIVRYRPRNFKHWPPYATIAENMLTNATLPYVRALADLGWERALARDAGFARGLNVHAGRITHEAVARALGNEFRAHVFAAA